MIIFNGGDEMELYDVSISMSPYELIEIIKQYAKDYNRSLPYMTAWLTDALKEEVKQARKVKKKAKAPAAA
jgi:hypothetical protein